MISLRCLGPIEVSVDGSDAPPELLWRKNLALLVYLARSPRGRSREHLVGILWPDKEDTKARHSLNEALRVLRRVVGDGLSTEGDNVRLEPGLVTVDLDRLQDLPSATLGQRFLEGFSVAEAPEFENWITAERTAIEAEQLRVLSAKAERALAEGAASRAAEIAEGGLRLSPNDETCARLAMRAYALGGRRSLALETFDRLTRALQDLGVAPDAATRSLVGRIRAERISPAAPAAASPTQSRAPLAGQARAQLAELTRMWTTALQGSARAAVLFGDPGTGKTLLGEELAARARLDGAVVARVRPSDGEAARETWAAILRGGLAAAELSGAPPAALAALTGLDPDIAVRFPAARGIQPLPVREGLLAAIHAVAEARPVMIFVDDAHRAAPEVVEGVAMLVERSKDLPVCLVVAAARSVSPAVDALAERIGRDLSGMVLATALLNERDLDELVGSVFPQFDESQRLRLVRRVLSDTAGNPFLAVQLVHAVRDGLNLPVAGTAAWPAALRTLDDTRPGDLPQSVSAAFRLRFRQLSEPAQLALGAVAVLGDGAAPEVLGRATELESTKLDQALDELEWTRWLIADARGYTFVARIAGEVVLADMVTGGQQRRIRERAGKR
ncbi:MAG: AAA family ATPase [Gemmatimonadetes bacterium]|nr:AAA family ATPase [Gemmatimonadota bacterium]